MKIFAIACALIAVMITGGVFSQSAIAQEAITQSPNSVRVYYFHTAARCVNCHNMEKWLKEIIDSDLAGDVKSGKLSLQIINTDDKGNEHYMTDYKLYTKSVVLALMKDGKEVKFENLAKIWDCLGSAEKFKTYVKDEIAKYQKEL